MDNLPRELLAGWKVLVIDDEADSADVASRVLRFYHAEIKVARDGVEGLEMLRTFQPDLVICDISMPVLDGWGVIHTIKNDRALMAVPVIALTAHAMAGDRQRAINAGFHNYLTKPFTPQTFVKDLLVLLTDLPKFDKLTIQLEEQS